MSLPNKGVARRCDKSLDLWAQRQGLARATSLHKGIRSDSSCLMGRVRVVDPEGQQCVQGEQLPRISVGKETAEPLASFLGLID